MEASRITVVEPVVRIPKSAQTIHLLKKELNRIEKQISEMSACEKSVEFKELYLLTEERDRIRDEIITNYSGKLSEFDKDNKELLEQVERMEDNIRENATNLECFQNINKLKLKKKDLLKSLALIKDDIDEIDLEKDEIGLQIKKLRKNKIGTNNEDIERLEKKLSEMGKKISELNEQKTEIEQNLMELISTFPEIIVEMKQPLTADGVVISTSNTPEEKFRIFALQNSIFLFNTQFSNYTIMGTVHSGLSVVYKSSKSNNQVVILKEISLSQSTDNNCDAIMNEIMNIVRLKVHSRIIKLNGVFIEPNFNKIYIETPYYSNGNLLEYVNKIKPQHDTKTLKIMLRSLFRKITETLQFIHSKDILHRDLKPQNILVNENGDYFTNENPITVELLSTSNQKLDSSEKLSLWQARLKKLKQLALARREGYLVSPSNEIRFDIDRENLLTDTSLTVEKVMTKDNNYSIFYKTFVKFKEEKGIDVGGLSNELYSKYTESMLMESKHFQKSETSSNENFILTDEPLTDESRIQLKAFGWLLKKLLIDCDDKTVYLPLNSFIFYYLLNGDIIYKKQALHINDMILTLSKFLREYDFELDNQIMNLRKCKNDKELQSIAYEETFTDVLSKTEKPLIMDNIHLYIISQLHPYFYSAIRMEKLKLIKEGFDWFNLKQFKTQLICSFSISTESELREFFHLQGPNFVEQDLSVNELKILLSGQSYIDDDLLLNEINFYFVSETMKDFLTKCIRKLTNSQLRQLLVWMTALSSIPIRGFSRKISIREQKRFEAHTCSFSFDIPSQITTYEEFETLFMNCLRLSSVATMEDFNDTENTLEN
ncbi:predicted protein [Naegleria gruberi]|uniref:non-specific serine/threonine protein kinase n=1 Tax=Naegleria gruberi TaxID=5762 RepID=D2W1D3_NAEGR|nr:uncharacterized protein NAEGRDRAFT_75176 [Naegleria gruberi]EFC37206.1 predicted protein [Naegleria gruberi]|eukprot:XP_002669950.1 predicted protein [Naegleria gruberi strain NEG-M]